MGPILHRFDLGGLDGLAASECHEPDLYSLGSPRIAIAYTSIVMECGRIRTRVDHQ